MVNTLRFPCFGLLVPPPRNSVSPIAALTEANRQRSLENSICRFLGPCITDCRWGECVEVRANRYWMSRSVILILQRLYNFHQVTQVIDIMCGYLSPHCMLCECKKHVCVHSLKHYGTGALEVMKISKK